jgi:hypothetical protein
MCETLNPARELISSKVGTRDAVLELCATLVTQQKTVKGRRTGMRTAENRVLLRGRFRKTKQLYPACALLSTAPVTSTLASVQGSR